MVFRTVLASRFNSSAPVDSACGPFDCTLIDTLNRAEDHVEGGRVGEITFEDLELGSELAELLAAEIPPRLAPDVGFRVIEQDVLGEVRPHKTVDPGDQDIHDAPR